MNSFNDYVITHFNKDIKIRQNEITLDRFFMKKIE